MASPSQKPKASKASRSVLGELLFKYAPYWPIFIAVFDREPARGLVLPPRHSS